MNLDPIYKEAGQITLEAMRELYSRLRALERKVGIVLPGGQVNASAISFSLGGAVFYQQATDPGVPTGPGIWEDTSISPSRWNVATTGHDGVREWIQFAEGRQP